MSADNDNPVSFAPIAVDTETAAKMLGLSPSTIRAYMRRGDLVARYSGSKPVFVFEELKMFLLTLPVEPSRYSSK